MSQPTQAPCTNSDPDIAGVGVRLAFFLQALLTFVAPALAIIDGTIDDSRSKRMFGLSMENLFLSGALVLTATMTWALEGPLILSYPLLDQFLDRISGGLAVDFLVNPRTAMPLYFFRFFHGVFGITVWTLVSVRSKALKCTGETFLLPGRAYIREGWVQGIFLLLYAFRIVHAVHTVAWALWRQPILGKDVHPSIMVTRMAIAGLIWIWLFVLTWKLVEKSVQANVVADGENSWGFGQILPMVLVLSHGRRVWKVFRQWQQRRAGYMNETRETELVVRPFRDLTARPVNSVPVAEGRESTAVAVPSGVDRRDGLTRRPTARRRVDSDKDSSKLTVRTTFSELLMPY
ncbi:hypothetical protein NLJ89_g5569 [Agrocybe chaxingu]|uniref:Uncharacterized protein n=1 Tax=Agrocybe chaxingu TaxID=84603 RepID=A0A9W8K0I5_9AGAR|nr:hypothetical protein NLJ89_g5569 [Agrocybe chaxingu]